MGQAQHIIPAWPSNFPPITNLPFTITGASLSLLLVFRTNTSYGRWDDARKMWGLMVSLWCGNVTKVIGVREMALPDEIQSVLYNCIDSIRESHLNRL